MAFKFAWLVELFEALEAARKKKAITTNRHIDLYAQATNEWFDQYEHKLARTGPSAVAFLSCILPERLPQRSYRVQEDTLVKIFCRVFHFGHTSSSALRRWREQNADFATTVEHTMTHSHLIMSKKLITLEEIDRSLLQLAGKGETTTKRLDEILTPILQHLTPSHTKWLVRMILKSYSPIQIPEATVLKRFHFLLSDLLTVQNSFDAAVEILEHDNIKTLPPNPVGKSKDVYLGLCAAHIKPKLGVMITRTQYEKARSVKHCCNMARQRIMSVERKYDGEYCQIHIDRSKTRGEQIQIFSKSGKNSTTDRVRLHGVIEAGLRLDQEDCAFDRNCIVDGELLVYSRTQKTILPFHKIRKHVMHGGTFIGTAADSPRKGDEQLMIVFYDILLLDDKVLAKEPHCERRKELARIVRNLDGEAELAYRQVINFGGRDAKMELREFFARATVQRWEGLVLKGCRDPYFSWESSKRVIKFKKDYINGLGDTVDLCIVGGRRDAKVVDQLGIGPLSWTTFYIACIENKEQARRHNEKPVFRIIDTVSMNGISKDNILHLNGLGEFLRIPFADYGAHMEVQNYRKDIPVPTELFKTPIVVDVMGAGFERPQNAAYYVLRFPRVVKLQRDRSFLDSSTFADLQEHADKSMKVSLDNDEKEEEGWIERLIAADGKNGVEGDGNQSQTTASPVQSTPGAETRGHEEIMASPAVTASAAMVNLPRQNTTLPLTPRARPSAPPRHAVTQKSQINTSPIPLTPGAGQYQHSQSTATPSPPSFLRSPGVQGGSPVATQAPKRKHLDTASSTSKRPRKGVPTWRETRSDFFSPQEAPTLSSLSMPPVTQPSVLTALTQSPHGGHPTQVTSSVRSTVSGGQPFEPPAVFRSPTKPTNSNSLVTPPSKRRHPLAQSSTMSPPQRYKWSSVAVVDDSDKENPDRQNPPSNRPGSDNILGLRGGAGRNRRSKRRGQTSSSSVKGSHANEMPKIQRLPPKSDDQAHSETILRTSPISQVSRRRFAEQVLCPDSSEVDARHPPNTAHCQIDKGLLVRLVDQSSPRATAEEIKGVGNEILNMRRALLRSASTQPKDATRPVQQKRLVMFYDKKITSLIKDHNCSWHMGDGVHSEECGILGNGDLVSGFFAGALLITTSVEFGVRVIWDWKEAMDGIMSP
ncbi:hypothetical protein PV11_02294 [Exophiala sideris]|uniref:ATP-dependent DNA ligase family profile domain-containing protein n=1 Tax=Exophiala sideris TaxID=1016849 RepID=A0A0D1XF26_9EURO|nr:hypothetical protein PV11_02294 [Exophiala sideris]